MSSLENRERFVNKGNLGAEIESLRRHKKNVEDRELYFLFSILDSVLVKLDEHIKRERESI